MFVKRNVYSINKRKKRAASNSAFVEVLIVTDSTVFNDHSRFVNSTDIDIVFQHMRIYFAYLINGVNQRYLNSFENDTDLNINIRLTNYLFLIVKDFFNKLLYI